ncbi:PTS sugar transporter subunit IIC [Brachybacterium endophyticum]|uniref:Permease IIC component n=1 Tax=Brachybacterium endophyticum TaxID=2182385 RepID=A0A2U2RNH3_9MICO|nr:PTS transporter subunit EIIC [Brachybacterium endophyticum]PWH07429.1 PTS sugar transporter subunit IIC [Brachybacterium endophyticum]
MKGFMHWLEHSFSPRLNVVNNNPWIVSLKDSVMQTLPFIFLGSVFAMLAVLHDHISWWPDFWVPYGWTMGMIGLFVAFLLPFNLMEKFKLRKQRQIAGLTGVVVFLIAVTPQVLASKELGLQNDSLGAGGMFVAIVTGLFVGVVMKIFGSFSFFTDSSAVPDFVRSWFDAMLPIALTVVPMWLIVQVAGFDLAGLIQWLLSPLSGMLQNPLGFMAAMFLLCFIYSMGISSWVLTPVIIPAMYAADAQNVAGSAENLVTYSSVFATYLWIGGIGATLPLALFMAFRARSRSLKTLGRASLVPSILNINEPIIFGTVAWNPTMMLGMWLQGIILPLIMWFFIKVVPLAPVAERSFTLWYTPYPISTWLSTSSLGALALVAILFVASAAIWFPFFRTHDRQLVRTEAEAAAAREAEARRVAESSGVSSSAGASGSSTGASGRADNGIRRSSKRLSPALRAAANSTTTKGDDR